jgi:uncharacterized protein (TIGR02421 family)
MKKPAPASAGPDEIGERLIRSVTARLGRNQRVRRSLPGRGRLHIDRQLPFLCVYRRPPENNDPGTDRLVTSEASYLIASGDAGMQPSLSRLVRGVAGALSAEFGAFLILEIWAAAVDPDDVPLPAAPGLMKPRFRILAPKNLEQREYVDALEGALSRIKVAKRAGEVEVLPTAACWPPRYQSLLPPREARALDCRFLGLEISPVYRNPATGEVYPLVLRELERRLTRALRQSFYSFACAQTTQCPVHYHVLGRRAVVKAVWEVDRRLAEVSDHFDFLLQVTPVDTEAAWRTFQNRKFQKPPRFRYRPLPADPVVLKRRLYGVPIERLEDPALLRLFRQKQDELDRRITMLLDINTRRFVHGSLQVFGGVDDEQLGLARQLLEKVPPRARDDTRGGYLDLDAFCRAAEAELEHYRRMWPQMAAQVQVRSDIAAGLMVSRGSLLVGEGARIPASRAEALLAHEVGTHVLTYYNGRAQPFRQLYSGLADYDTLQEGLAVLAEYLVGGLSRPRIRLLAGRVVAVRAMLDGASFVETFRMLAREHRFDQRTAFLATMRVYRGGGLTKDAVYLRGLCELLDYLAGGGELEPLYVGKIAVDHVPIIQELRYREVLKPPPLRPRYLEAPGAAERLERARVGLTLLQVIERNPREPPI